MNYIILLEKGISDENGGMGQCVDLYWTKYKLSQQFPVTTFRYNERRILKQCLSKILNKRKMNSGIAH